MNYRVIENGGQVYLHYMTGGAAELELTTVNQFISDCMEHRTNLIMLDADALPAAFFSLRTGLAGEVMQKFGQYHIKAALVIPDESVVKGKFRDMLIETNRGGTFRSFSDAASAEAWLIA